MIKAEKERMLYLVNTLNEARKAYYAEGESPLSDYAYDKMLYLLKQLEVKTKQRLSASPTNKVGVTPYTDKHKHEKPILSLKDTKSFEELIRFLGEHEGLLSWKLDGLSIVLYYDDGKLKHALTRGDGNIGKDILLNVLHMPSVPKEIPFKEKLIVRGEGCVSIKHFDQINNTKQGENYSNPRNLAAGLVNSIKTPSLLLRYVDFIAHSIVDIYKPERFLKRTEQFEFLYRQGFNVVEFVQTPNFRLQAAVEDFTDRVHNYIYPVDGLVLTLNNIEYAESLGATSHHPRYSMAFKWPDKHATSRVVGMKWSVSNTGLITPVVIFEPIELEGSVVRQANLHSLKIFEELAIGEGDILDIYKANKIIPKVHDNLSRSKGETHPQVCPKCGQPTTVVETDKTRKLYCETCAGRKVE